MPRRAWIVGAGLAGLAAAVALSRAGWQISVAEQAPALGEVGAGIQLSPNAMKALRALGLDTAAQAAGFVPDRAAIRHYATGRAYTDAPLNPSCTRLFGAPYLHIHRADLHQLLRDAAQNAGAQILTGNPVRGYTEDAAGIAPVLDHPRAPGDLLIGADGIRSTIRGQMLGDDRPRFTGQVAWRGLVPVGDVPAGLVPPGVTVWAGPGRHVVVYYVRGGSLINVVAVEERDDWRSEGWMQPGDPAELQAAFAGWHPQIQTVLAALQQTYLWALFDRAPLRRWHQGRAVLIGDACHPTLPFLAQGAAMGLEDAVVLQRLLDRFADVTAALAAFERRRKPRASALQAQARANARLFHRTDMLSRVKLSLAALLPGPLSLAPVARIYAYDPARV